MGQQSFPLQNLWLSRQLDVVATHAHHAGRLPPCVLRFQA